MATKIKLGNRPKNFKRSVEFPLPEGGTGKIEMLFKYRTRPEFGALIDEIVSGAEDIPVDEDTGRILQAAIISRSVESNAEYILKIAEGWNLDEEFSAENIKQLAEELPGAVTAITSAYRDAIVDGRLGN